MVATPFGVQGVETRGGMTVLTEQDYADARARYGGARIAVVVPYVGDQLPAWFSIFAQSCAASAPLVDWLIMHSGTRTPPPDAPWVPSNVHFLNLGLEKLGQLHARLVDDIDERETAAGFFTDLLTTKPYYLVEFKVAIGHIFAEYLTPYSHWAFGDLDMLMGDLVAWTEPEELSMYDIFTYSFGDQFRMYTRGQWTVHRNIERVNTMYRNCGFLTTELMRRLRNHARYESAEGCYALQVSQSNKLNVKYAVKVFTGQWLGSYAHSSTMLLDYQRRPSRLSLLPAVSRRLPMSPTT